MAYNEKLGGYDLADEPMAAACDALVTDLKINRGTIPTIRPGVTVVSEDGSIQYVGSNDDMAAAFEDVYAAGYAAAQETALDETDDYFGDYADDDE